MKREELIKVILESMKDADPHKYLHDRGVTPEVVDKSRILASLSDSGENNALRMLLEFGVDPDKRAHRGKKPLYNAALNQVPEDLLVAFGATMRYKDLEALYQMANDGSDIAGHLLASFLLYRSVIGESEPKVSHLTNVMTQYANKYHHDNMRSALDVIAHEMNLILRWYHDDLLSNKHTINSMLRLTTAGIEDAITTVLPQPIAEEMMLHMQVRTTAIDVLLRSGCITRDEDVGIKFTDNWEDNKRALIQSSIRKIEPNYTIER